MSDKYDGPLFQTENGEEFQDQADKLVVPILRVRQEFPLKGNDNFSRMQFLLVLLYVITVHKSQGVTLSRAVCDISERKFATGLSYVAISRVSRLDGLMMDVPFNWDCVNRDSSTKARLARLADYDGRWRNAKPGRLGDMCSI